MVEEKHFHFVEEDQVGKQTLDVIAGADRFNRWMYKSIVRHCRGEILEVGSGIGNISRFFLEDGYSITLSDIREGYCTRLKEGFQHFPNLKGVVRMDLVDPAFDQQFSHQLGKYNTIFSLNVLEHIKDDHQAIQNARKLLQPGGRLIILVPAYQKLYNQFDKGLGHYRRYTKSSLRKVFENNGLEVIHARYFNFIGVLGWFVSGKLQKNDAIPQGQMNLYNRLVPLFQLLDRVILRSMGLSVIVVGSH